MNYTHQRYTPLSIFLHWLTFFLLVAVYTCIEVKGYFPKGSALRDGLKTWHFIFGIAVLFITIIRLLNRSFTQSPAIVPPLTKLQQGFSHIVHTVLYSFLISMPLLGWLMVNAKGKTVALLGFSLPTLIQPDLQLANELYVLHEWIGQMAYFLIALHVLAALYHHYVQRDNTLSRMLPK